MPLSVNQVEISDRDINIESALHEGSIVERRHRAAVALVIRELLRQRAQELDLDGAQTEAGSDDVIEALLAREISVPDHDETACRRYYEANPDRFRSPDIVIVHHILLAAAPSDSETRDRVRHQAEDLIIELCRAPQRFAALAGAHSACPSREHGGALGPISRGQTVPEFEDVVLRLPVGLAGRPLESRYGYHIVRVDERHEGERLPFATVRERIARYLQDQVWRQAVSQYIRILAESSEIRGIDLDAVHAPGA